MGSCKREEMVQAHLFRNFLLASLSIDVMLFAYIDSLVQGYCSELQGASSIDTGNEVDFVWDAEQVTTEGRPGPQPSYSETFHMSIATDPWHSPWQMPRATYPDPACSLIPFECTPCCQSAWILPSFRSRRSRTFNLSNLLVHCKTLRDCRCLRLPPAALAFFASRGGAVSLCRKPAHPESPASSKIFSELQALQDISMKGPPFDFPSPRAMT
eukprot:s615_g41.t1